FELLAEAGLDLVGTSGHAPEADVVEPAPPVAGGGPIAAEAERQGVAGLGQGLELLLLLRQAVQEDRELAVGAPQGDRDVVPGASADPIGNQVVAGVG